MAILLVEPDGVFILQLSTY